MTEPTLRNAPTLLAALDRDLVCRHASCGWLKRLGRSAEKEALSIRLDELFELDDETRLADQLRDLLRNGTPLHESPVTLTGTSGVTRGFLSAWRAENGTEEPWLYLSATCSDEFDTVLSELQNLRTMHELILDAAGEGIFLLLLRGNHQVVLEVDRSQHFSASGKPSLNLYADMDSADRDLPCGSPTGRLSSWVIPSVTCRTLLRLAHRRAVA